MCFRILTLWYPNSFPSSFRFALSIDEKFKSFGFQIINIDGHNIQEIIDAFDVAKNVKERPTCIVAKTIKGKGVSFMENNPKWHNGAISDEEYKIAMKDLGEE